MRKGFSASVVFVVAGIILISALILAFHYFGQLSLRPKKNVSAESQIITRPTTPSRQSNSQNTAQAEVLYRSNFYAMVITSDTSVQFLVTDPKGLQTGYVSSDGKYIQDIPNSIYGTQYGIADARGNGQHTPDYQYFKIGNYLIPTTYKVNVYGLKDGQYKINIILYPIDNNNKAVDKVFDETISASQTQTYSINVVTGIINPLN